MFHFHLDLLMTNVFSFSTSDTVEEFLIHYLCSRDIALIRKRTTRGIQLMANLLSMK